MLAVVDVETTGNIYGFHEIIQIAIVPLTIGLEIADIPPFYLNIAPTYPERMQKESFYVHGINIDDLLTNAVSQGRAVDMLVDWFDNLDIGFSRSLIPVAHNWAFERGFLVPWLTPQVLDTIFHPHPRDTMVIGAVLNDRASMLYKEIPFKSLSLTSMCKVFGIEHSSAHDALGDCIATAKLYAAIMRAMI